MSVCTHRSATPNTLRSTRFRSETKSCTLCSDLQQRERNDIGRQDTALFVLKQERGRNNQDKHIQYEQIRVDTESGVLR